jgi:hypothetical protein
LEAFDRKTKDEEEKNRNGSLARHRVARFFFTQYTKMGKINQMTE